MRIGIDATVLPSQPVGVGNYIIQLIRALAALETEHKLVIFVHRNNRQLIGELSALRGLEWLVLPDKSPAQRLMWEQSVLPFLVKRMEIQLLHSLHYTRPIFLPCASLVTFHDMTFFLYPHLHTRFKRIFFPLAMRISARLSDALIAVSENTRQDIQRVLGVSAQKIYLVPNGVNEQFRPISDQQILQKVRHKYHLPPEFILFVGTIEPRKNLTMLIDAYNRLLQEGCNHFLVLVGKAGWMFEPVFHQVEALGLQEKILFTGYIPAEDLPVVYNLAQVFVYPSLYEGFGFPPLEAMACGVPVITTGISAMREQVGDAGILVPPQDVEALTNAMRTLISDHSLRERLSEKGRQRAAQFTWKRTAQETMNVYQKVLTGKTCDH